MILVVIDAHSKWIEAIPMSTATAFTTIQQLRKLFAQFGIPDSVVSDNGPQFAASEFEEFCKLNGIHHTRVAPYHPSSNGLAERAVKIVKQGLKKLSLGTLSDRISRMLLQYRITPHTTTGVPPAELLLGKKPRSRLDMLKPRLNETVQDKQNRQKENHDKSSRVRHFAVGEEVFVKNHRKGQNWLPGKITGSSGPLSFQVRLSDGRNVRCHQDHLRQRSSDTSLSEQLVEDTESGDVDISLPPNTTSPLPNATGPSVPVSRPSLSSTSSSVPQELGITSPTLPQSPLVVPAVRTYPSRRRANPDWFRVNYLLQY